MPIASTRELIGNTPLVQLRHLFAEYDFKAYAKMEMLNLGGSVKDRPAFSMVEHALEQGLIHAGDTVIESSSGNMGIGLAQACLNYGLSFICVADSRTNVANVRIMEAYGARVEVVTKPLTEGGSLLEARLAKVRELLETIPNSYWPNQYKNLYNPKAHEQTVSEIVDALDGKVDYLFCTVGTCGTLRGCSDFLQGKGIKTRIYAVDAVGSVIFGGKSGPRLVPGHGAAVRPGIFRDGMANEVVYSDDEDCLRGCRDLLSKEMIFAGGSSGAVVSAVKKVAPTIPKGATVAMIFADRGERYLDTIYNDEWIAKNFPKFNKQG